MKEYCDICGKELGITYIVHEKKRLHDECYWKIEDSKKGELGHE